MPVHRATIVVLVVLAASACAGRSMSGTSPSAAPERIELTVFAAASLREAFGRLAERYRAIEPSVTLTFAFDASSTHRARIEQGARADLFASADLANPEAVAAAGLTAAPLRAFAGNLLTIVTPSDDPGGVATPADLARPGVRIVATGDRVPVARYAADLVTRLATLPGYPRDFAARVAANVVTREDDVAAVVAKIQLGEGDAAIVYATEARRVPSVRIVAIPEEAHVIATYAAVRLRDAPEPEATDAFLDWLTGREAQGELRLLGFSPPP